MKNPTTQASSYTEILALLDDYYEGLYRIDLAKLRNVFSPSARYATIANGELLELSMDEYLPRVAQRTAPAEDGVPHGYCVRSIRLAGEHTALAELECSLFGHDYTDLLSLLRVDGRWRIQAKVFEGVPHAIAEAS